eukprot:CAMPEP_0113926064 /NCGR_PEP_ID=MMETSP1159-20121227/3548_1 /TAXON_ID=88271 /ORGANISM="Picocystis salinarum" /LENGTH=362 /DNA_ID=CAMNT_0000926417 /DNA_START=58 /DNA_END=1144 /DNA_ORIENTATION=- /assembly_acc=CAM_ASM_000767
MDDHVEERSKTHVRACARVDETAGELLQRLWARKAPVLRTHVPALDATGGLRAGDAVEVTCVLDERHRDGADVDGECADACLMRFVAACCAHQDAQGLAMDVLWIDCVGRAQPRKLRDLLRRLHRAHAVDRDTCEAWTRESLKRVTLVRCDSSRDVRACLPLARHARLVAAQGIHAHVKRERVHATAHGPSFVRASECLLEWLHADAHAVQASLVASSRVLHLPGRRLRDDASQTWRERVAERRLYVDEGVLSVPRLVVLLHAIVAGGAKRGCTPTKEAHPSMRFGRRCEERPLGLLQTQSILRSSLREPRGPRTCTWHRRWTTDLRVVHGSVPPRPSCRPARLAVPSSMHLFLQRRFHHAF